MKSLLRVSNLRIVSFFLAVILALPLNWKGLTGFYNWLSPYVMLNSVLALKSFVFLNIFAFIIIAFLFFRKRWFCNNLCPAGWSCDVVSELSRRKQLTYKSMPDINKWMALISLIAAAFGLPLFIIFDPLAIFNGFFSIFTGRINLIAVISLTGFPILLLLHIFFPGIWCRKLCPLGGFQLIVEDIKNLFKRLVTKQDENTFSGNAGRRYFIMSGLGVLAGISIPPVLKPSPSPRIRPPASVEPSLFNSLCCRCGNCVKACPTAIIKPVTDCNEIMAFMTPEISFSKGYCIEDCNLCSRVCPTGSITLFSIKAKNQLFMGSALFSPENCLLVNNTECVRCRESCKYGAIEFVSGGNILNVMPEIITDRCVGCGACEVVCPAGCIIIEPVSPVYGVKPEKNSFNPINKG